MSYPSTPPAHSPREKTKTPSPSLLRPSTSKSNPYPTTVIRSPHAPTTRSAAQQDPPLSTPPISPATYETSPTPSEVSEEDDPPDPEREARIKHSDLVYEKVLKHMDWDGRYGPIPPDPFVPFFYIQLARVPQYHASGLPDPVPAQSWARDGSLEPAKAVWISTEEQMKELEAWAEKQGDKPLGGMLCPDTFLIDGKRASGRLLVGI